MKVGRANFRCLFSDAAIETSYVRQQAKMGNMAEVLIGIVAEGNRSRLFLSPSSQHEDIARSAIPSSKPEGVVPTPSHDVDRLPMYGMPTWGDAFADRQLVALNTFSDLVHEARAQIEADALSAGMAANQVPLRDGGTGAKAYAEAVSVYLAFAISRMADRGSTICSWDSGYTKIRNTFGRQAIPMTWDYAEANPFSSSSGNWTAMRDWVWKVVSAFMPTAEGTETQQDAQTVVYPANAVISTDPPYYDNIGYSDLSDFFYSWMRPIMKSLFPSIFSVLVTPKSEELIAASHRHGSKKEAEEFFLQGMSKAVANMAAQSSERFPATIYYAFKQSEIAQEGISSTGWATFLQAVIEAGYSVVGTWPMRTEMANRMIASGTNALANSVILVCRRKE